MTEHCGLSDDFAWQVNGQVRQHSVGWPNVAAATALGQHRVIARACLDICRVNNQSRVAIAQEIGQNYIIIIFISSIGGLAAA